MTDSTTTTAAQGNMTVTQIDVSSAQGLPERTDMGRLFRVEMTSLDELRIVPLSKLAADILRRFMNPVSTSATFRSSKDWLSGMEALCIKQAHDAATYSPDGSWERQRMFSGYRAEKMRDAVAALDAPPSPPTRKAARRGRV